MNERFGTSFTEFYHSEESATKVLNLIAERQRKFYGSGLAETGFAIPSEKRNVIKDALRDEYYCPSLYDIRTQAEQIYDLVMSYHNE